MKKNVYAIVDAKAQVFNAPFLAHQNPEALRMFETALNTPESNWAEHAADYSLIFIGEFDMETGTLTDCPHIILANGLDLVQQAPAALEAV